MKTHALRPDNIGIAASFLCLIHCIATPFVFIAKACSVTPCADAPVWWQLIDYLFLVISFVAILHSTKDSTKTWIRTALWSSWIILLICILNESFQLVSLPSGSVYVPALFIIGFHFYNIKYCKCTQIRCSVD